MIWRSEKARSNWSEDLVRESSRQQSQVLNIAAQLVRLGGWLVYSTCTFSPEEYETLIDRFLKSHPEFVLIPLPMCPGFSTGRPDWAPENTSHPLALKPLGFIDKNTL